MGTTDAERLAELLAKQEITEAIYKYCRSMDRMDRPLGYSVFHPDAVGDYGEMFQGSGYEFVDFACQAHEGFLTHQHQVGNMLIVVEGERAFSETYVTATFRRLSKAGERLQLCSIGRYCDHWERREGIWAIARRTYLHAMDETRPVVQADYTTSGTRDYTDPSYTLLDRR